MTVRAPAVTSLGSVRRGILGIASQLLNSLSNLALAVLVARHSSPSDFGGWAVALAFYVFILQVARAVGSMPVMLTAGDGDRAALRGSTAVALTIGAIAGACFLLAVPLVNQSVAKGLIAVGVLLPVLFIQDALRYWFIQIARPGEAAILDGIWLAGFALGVAGLLYFDRAGVTSLTIAWGVGAAIAAVFGCVRLRCVPSIRGVASHVRTHARTSLGLLADTVLVAGTAQLLPVLIAIASGLIAAASFRAAQTVMGAVTMIVAGLTPVALSAAVRGGKRTPRSFVIGWSVMVFGVSAVNGVAVLLLPDRWGEAMLGANWEGAAPLLVPLVVASLLRGPLTGTLILLKAQLRLASAVRLRSLTVLPSIGLPFLGAFVGGGLGAAWGLAAGTAVGGLLSLAFVFNGRGLALDRPAVRRNRE